MALAFSGEDRSKAGQYFVHNIFRNAFHFAGLARVEIEWTRLVAPDHAGCASACVHQRNSEACRARELATGSNRNDYGHAG